MSISAAFSASQSGLAAVERWSEVTAGNIANADRASYARRSVLREPDAGGGVLVSGIQRESDVALDRMYRSDLSRAARQEALASGLELYTSALGEPGDARAITTRLADFENAMVQLANAPEQIAVQSGALQAAESLVTGLNEANAALDEAASLTLTRIGTSTGEVNEGLRKIADINRELVLTEAGTQRHASLMDQLSGELDGLAKVIDVRTIADAAGRVTVYTSGGTALVEGDQVRALRFDEGTGRLMAGSADITPGVAGARGFSEGRLAGEIELWNQTLPKMQLQLDEVARSLIGAFEAADASLAPGAAGLFTDAGAALSAGAPAGLAGRIAINTAVIPGQGGALWRMRDGIGAATEGPASNPVQVNAFVETFKADQSFATAAGLGTGHTFAEFAAALVSDQHYVRVQAQSRSEELAIDVAATEATRSGLSGVNVDDELQQLAQIEQSYAANSQVLKSLTQMLDTLLAVI